MRKYYAHIEWCRYADDGLVHCKTKRDAYHLLDELHQRFKQCNLKLHPDKTKVVYCNNSRYAIRHPYKSFDFLGFTFRDCWIMNPNTKQMFLGFNPAISNTAVKSVRSQIRQLNIRNRTDLNLEKIAKFMNPRINGWINYYGIFNKQTLSSGGRHINLTLMAWLMKRHKNLVRKKTRAARIMLKMSQENSELFAHWKQGIGVFA